MLYASSLVGGPFSDHRNDSRAFKIQSGKFYTRFRFHLASFQHMQGFTAQLSHSEPNYWWTLSAEDQRSYLSLKEKLSAVNCRSESTSQYERFRSIVEVIYQYVVRGDDQDLFRGMVCGICWMGDTIAVNSHQLRFMIAKCKSSINSYFKKLGYTSIFGRAETMMFLCARIPLLRNNQDELRKWTLRRLSNTLVPSPPPKVAPPTFEISLEGIAKPKVQDFDAFDDSLWDHDFWPTPGSSQASLVE